MTDLVLIQTLDFDQLHSVARGADRVVAGVGEDWPQVNVFRKERDTQNTVRAAMNAQGGTTYAGAHRVPTPGSFGGLENREEVIAKPSTYASAGAAE